MLLRLNEKDVIKTDRYSYMLCQDMGLTKFPKGIVAIYFKPVGHYGKLAHVRTNDEQFLKLVQAEKEMFELFAGIEIEGSVSIFDCEVTKDKDCYIAKYHNYTVYPSSAFNAFVHCWDLYIRENTKFGSSNNTEISYCTIDDLLKEIEEAKKLVGNFSTGSSVG